MEKDSPVASTTTTQRTRHTDSYGIERARPDEPGAVEKLRGRYPLVDRLLRMQERFSSMGGIQYAAGITYFSVLSVFPILMLVFAGIAYVLASDPQRLQEIQDHIASSVGGDVGKPVNAIINTAIEQRSAIAGVGGLTALWSGLSWMNHLRYGASKMWKADPMNGSFVKRKFFDLLGLIMLIVALVVAFGITAVGSSGLTRHLLHMLHLDTIPGIDFIVYAVAIVVGLIANFLVFLWLLIYLPRTKVPVRAALSGAVMGAVAFEIFKQLGSLFFSHAVKNPAGATFGPIIGVMVLFYIIWVIVMYCSAWTATSKAAIDKAGVDVPAPAVIRIRQEAARSGGAQGVSGKLVGAGAAAGAAAAAVAAIVFKHRK